MINFKDVVYTQIDMHYFAEKFQKNNTTIYNKI